MKKYCSTIMISFLIILIFGWTVSADVNIDDNNFPDATFRSFVLSNYDMNHDGFLSTEEGNAAWICNCKERGITSLQGIEYLTGLENLYCNKNNLKSLDLSNNEKLISVLCEENQLTSINVTGCTKLQQLRCYSNHLSSIDVMNCPHLNYLDCSMNAISSIDTSRNPALQNFHIIENQLTYLDVSSNTRLKELWCTSNKIEYLILGSNDWLSYLTCYDNPFTRLDITNNRELRSLVSVQYRHEEEADYVYYMYDQKMLRFGKKVALVNGDQIIPATEESQPIPEEQGPEEEEEEEDEDEEFLPYPQPMKAKGKTVWAKSSVLKTKNQTASVEKIMKVSDAVGELTFKKTSGNAKIVINSRTGKLTMKKGLKKGTYKVKIRVTASGDDEYEEGSVYVAVYVKVK